MPTRLVALVLCCILRSWSAATHMTQEKYGGGSIFGPKSEGGSVFGPKAAHDKMETGSVSSTTDAPTSAVSSSSKSGKSIEESSLDSEPKSKRKRKSKLKQSEEGRKSKLKQSEEADSIAEPSGTMPESTLNDLNAVSESPTAAPALALDPKGSSSHLPSTPKAQKPVPENEWASDLAMQAIHIARVHLDGLDAGLSWLETVDVQVQTVTYFGCAQVWRAMAPFISTDGGSAAITNGQVATAMVGQVEQWYTIALALKHRAASKGKCSARANAFFGQVVSLVQGSYSLAHTVRALESKNGRRKSHDNSRCGNILQFQSYQLQDPALHAKAEQKPKKGDTFLAADRKRAWACAVAATSKLVKAFQNNLSVEKFVKLVQQILEVAPDRQEVIAGGTLSVFRDKAAHHRHSHRHHKKHAKAHSHTKYSHSHSHNLIELLNQRETQRNGEIVVIDDSFPQWRSAFVTEVTSYHFLGYKSIPLFFHAPVTQVTVSELCVSSASASTSLTSLIADWTSRATQKGGTC